MARREKQPVHKVVMTEGKRNIIRGLLEEYDIHDAHDIQEALKDLLGGTIKEMMEAEMEDHLGYGRSERSDSDDYRNGYKTKRVNSSYGSMDIDVPQDRNSTFEPKVVKKRQKDISEIDQKIISMYAKGMTTSQISDTLMDIYGFEASEGFISDVTCILSSMDSWFLTTAQFATGRPFHFLYSSLTRRYRAFLTASSPGKEPFFVTLRKLEFTASILLVVYRTLRTALP